MVHSAADAETGLQLLVREKPDLVVTDLRLPGMSGLEFLQAVKRANAALPVVVMTAYGTVESAVEAMKVGASNYVTKPFSFDELVLVIRKELDIRTACAKKTARCAKRSAAAIPTTTSSRRATRCRPCWRWSSASRRQIRRCCSAAKAASEKT